LNFSLKNTPSLSRVKWIPQSQKEIKAYKTLYRQIHQGKGIYLSGEQHNHSFKAFEIKFIVNLSKQGAWQISYYQNINLAWAHYHSHEPHIYGCFSKAANRYQVVRIYIAEIGMYIKSD
jgi:hypothetical protein